MWIEPKVFPYEGQACQSAKAKQTHPTMDSIENGQHHPVIILPPVTVIRNLRLSLEQQRKSTETNMRYRYNAKRRHWRKTRIGIWTTRPTTIPTSSYLPSPLLLLRKLYNFIISDPGSKLAGKILRTGLGLRMDVFREGFWRMCYEGYG